MLTRRSVAAGGWGAVLVVASALAALSSAPRAHAQTAQQPVGVLGAVPKDLGPNEQFAGVPWTGEPGVTETVDEMMAREAARPKVSGPPRERKPFRRFEGPKRENPDALSTGSQQPPPRGAAVAAPAAAEPVVSAGFTAVTNWYGPRYSESGFVPPDSNGAVGPTQVMVISNGRYKLYDKTGVLQGLDVTDDVFWFGVTTSSAVDAHIRYDPPSGRWFLVAIDLQAASNRILVAVSSSSTISSSSSFAKFAFVHDSIGTVPNVDTGSFADFPSLGVDANALYVGTNEWSGSTFLHSTVYVINKASLVGGSLIVSAFRGLSDLRSPQGVANDDPSATEGYFIGEDASVFSKLDIRRITNPGAVPPAAPSISGSIGLNVPTTSYPIVQVALGSSNPLDALDDRLFTAAITKNRVTGVASLWTAHNIEVNSSGVAAVGGGRNGSRWYQIDNLTTTPTLTQSGTMFDSSASNPTGFWIPSIAANGQGHAVFGSSWAGALVKPDVLVGSRLSGDAAGTMPQGNSTFGAGACSGYNLGPLSGDPLRQRWGDYSQVVVDPVDDQTMWTFQEICDATNSWSVFVVKLQAPPPATPVSASPSTINKEVASTDVTITGTLGTSGGFFDAGPGFTRIGASVSGGVTVNSVTFVDPTHVTLNISTVGTASGVKNVTITNPDGQSGTGNSLLTVGFTDDPLIAGTTGIKAVHITELRSRIDAVRAKVFLGPYSYTYAITAGTSIIRAVDITQMRQALNEAYAAAALPLPSYSTSPGGGVSIVVADIADLRAAVKAIE